MNPETPGAAIAATTSQTEPQPSIRHRTRITLAWGVAYGAVWSLAPGFLSELLRNHGEAVTVVLAGAVTGALVTLLLAPFLTRSKWWGAVLLGVVSLPLGAGLFGIIVSWIQWMVMRTTGTHYRFVMQVVEPPGYVFGPLKAGGSYAIYSTCSAFAILFIPLAILTTLHLRQMLLCPSSRTKS